MRNTFKLDWQSERKGMEMSDAVLVALIGLAGSGIGSVLGILVSSKLTQ